MATISLSQEAKQKLTDLARQALNYRNLGGGLC